METVTEFGPPGVIGRVKTITNHGRTLFLEFRNGSIMPIDVPKPTELRIGSVVLVQSDKNRLVPAPEDLWPDQTSVGIIRLKRPDKTIVEIDGRYTIIDTHYDMDYQEGNTVEVKGTHDIIRVLSEEPIRTLDLRRADDIDISKFKRQGHGKETFEDFGGLGGVVARARELIEIPLKYRNRLSEMGARPIKGVLFTGPPGTGKTMLARIIANATDAEFYKISGPEILSQWYGQSEKILQNLFEDAANQKRAIIFFDEIDSIARHRSGESHEASQRIVTQLLTLMDGFDPQENVTVVATTNRPQDIDVALRRPGRFDWEIHFPLPDRKDRQLILKAAAQRMRMAGPIPYEWLSRQTRSWSPAELVAILNEAALLAVADDRHDIIAEDCRAGLERVAVRRNVVYLSSRGDSG